MPTLYTLFLLQYERFSLWRGKADLNSRKITREVKKGKGTAANDTDDLAKAIIDPTKRGNMHQL
jgi:hypothetical protein